MAETAKQFTDHSLSKKKRQEDRVVSIFVDEEGDLGKYPNKIGDEYKPNKTFGFGISVTEDPDKFSEVSKHYQEERGRMLRAKNLEDDEKIFYAAFARRSGAKFKGFYIDKMEDTPEGWLEQESRENIAFLLEEALDQTLSEIKSKEVTVVVDQHSGYTAKRNGEDVDRVAELSEILSETHGKNVRMLTNRKKSDPYSDHMQTADIIAHALFEEVELGESAMSIEAGLKTIRVGKGTSIRKKR